MRPPPLLRHSLLALAFCIGCVGGRDVAPVILYGTTPRSPEEIAVIRIVGKRHPTIHIRKMSRVGANLETVYEIRSDRAWAPLEHFGGLQATQREAPREDVQAIPDEFQVLPGMYRVDFSYVPVVDRWGWTHRPAEDASTWLDCQAGRVYLLEGRMEESESRWSLVKLVLVAGEGGG